MVPLSLPDLVWKPFVGESVDITDLKATDVHTVRSLGEIAEGRVPHSQSVELLTQALLSSSLCPVSGSGNGSGSGSGVWSTHLAATTVAIKSFLVPSNQVQTNYFEYTKDKNKMTGTVVESMNSGVQIIEIEEGKSVVENIGVNGDLSVDLKSDKESELD